MQWLDQRTTARSARQDGGTTEAAVGSIGAAVPTGAASGFPELSMRSLTASRLPQLSSALRRWRIRNQLARSAGVTQTGRCCARAVDEIDLSRRTVSVPCPVPFVLRAAATRTMLTNAVARSPPSGARVAETTSTRGSLQRE